MLFIRDEIIVEIRNSVKEKQIIYDRILSDIKKVHSFYTIKKAHIIVDERIYSSSENEKMTISVDSVSGEEFRKELIKHTLDVYDNWKIEGLYRFIFEERVQDVKKIMQTPVKKRIVQQIFPHIIIGRIFLFLASVFIHRIVRSKR